MRLSYALIGCGRISPNHIAAALQNDLDFVAICDIDRAKMDEAAEKFNLPTRVKKYVDYKEMLKSEKPELVAVCTESGSHAEVSMECLEAGSNLIIEKPIALSVEAAEQIVEAAKRNNLKACACHQNRFNKSIQKIKEAISEGRFGKLLHATANIRWNRQEDYYRQAPWRGTWEHDGGALMNQCIHNIDLLRWLMGNEIIEVVGMTDNLIHDFIEAEDIGTALIKFSNGGYGIVEGTTNIYPKNFEETLCIFGEKGTVKVGGKSVNIIEEWQFNDKLDTLDEIREKFNETPPNIYGFGHSPLYTDMVEAIQKDRQPYVTAEDGKRAIELVLAIYKSAAEGKIVKMPLEKCKTTEFIGRFDK